jgi:hypothetical protein
MYEGRAEDWDHYSVVGGDVGVIGDADDARSAIDARVELKKRVADVEAYTAVINDARCV